MTEIIQFFHCANCMKHIPRGKSPQSHSRLEAGWTKEGIKVQCIRCNLNVISIDFMGQKVGASD